MSGFDYTCTISGLPIGLNDNVRFMLLVKNDHDDNVSCQIDGIWVPRNFPLKAKYNELGSVKDLQCGVQQYIWFEAFKRDLIVKGAGDDPYYDIAVDHDMSLEKWLSAIYKERITVAKIEKSDEGFVLSIGIPTVDRIYSIFEKSSFAVSYINLFKHLTVDELEPGLVRIRHPNSLSPIHSLKTIQSLLENEYATMIRTGTGSFPEAAELVIAPKPLLDNNGHYNIKLGKSNPRKELSVFQAIIREDVWQALSNFTYNNWRGFTISKESYLNFIKKAYTSAMEILGGENEDYKKIYRVMLGAEISKTKSSYIADYHIRNIVRDAVPFIFGLSSHFDLFCKTKHTKEEAEDFIKTIAEYSIVTDVLDLLGYYWKPSGIGPQYNDWERHKKFHKTMLSLCKKQINNDDEEFNMGIL